jgi:hypothetical protein
MLYRGKRNANDPEADGGNVLEGKSLKILTRMLTKVPLQKDNTTTTTTTGNCVYIQKPH